MINLVKDEFEDRQSDIDAFCDLAQLIERGTILVTEDLEGNLHEIDISDQLRGIVRSVIQLISYNQVEATMRGCLESVYDHIEDSNVGYDQLNDSFQKSILHGTLKHYQSSSNELHSKLRQNLNGCIPSASLFIKKVFNGNVSKDTVHKIEKSYQISITSPEEARAGIDLNDLKDARNDLAHGNVSFSSHGALQTYTDIIEKGNRAHIYLNSIINSFDQYIMNEKYLRPIND